MECHARFQGAVREKKLLRPPAVDGHDFGAVPLGLEAVEAVPAADVEHALARQVIRQPKTRVVVTQFLNLVDAGSDAPGAEIDAVPPARGEERGPLFLRDLIQFFAQWKIVLSISAHMISLMASPEADAGPDH